MIGNIQKVIKPILAGATYQPYGFPSQSAIGVEQGNGNGVQRFNPEYEISYKFTEVSDTVLNCFVRTGADNFQHVAGFGNIVLRTFDKTNKKFNDDRGYVYQPSLYCVYELFPFIYQGSVYIATYERLRSDPTNEALGRNCILKSTDGLVGRNFGAPVVQSFINYSVPSAFCDGPSNTKYLYFGVQTVGVTGLYRALFSADGTLSGFSSVLLTQLSENSILNIDNAGNMLCVYRINTGNRLFQTRSSNYGATWTAGVSTGLGAATGAKVTPSMHFSKTNPTRINLAFNDRGAGNRDFVTTGTLATNALTPSWRLLSSFSTTRNTNGNGELYPINEKGDLIYVAQSASATNDPNNVFYWIFNEGFNVDRRPWLV